MTREAYWQIAVDKIDVPGASVCKGGCPAIVDSGTSLLVGPSLQIAEINRVRVLLDQGCVHNFADVRLIQHVGA